MVELTEHVILPGADYKAACDAVREKTGKTDGIRSGDLAAQIRGIAPKLQEKTVIPTTQRQTVEADAHYEGLSAVTVAAINLQEKTASPGTEAQTIVPDDGYDGLEEVVVAAMKLQEKTAVPSETAQTIEPDAGFDGLSKVNMGAIPGGYIVPSGTLNITENGEYDVTEKTGVVVAVESGTNAQTRKLTINNNRNTSCTVYYVSDDSGEIKTLSVARNSSEEVELIPASIVFIQAKGSRSGGSSSSSLGCVLSCVNITETYISNQLFTGSTTTLSYLYEIIACLTDISADAEITLSNS